MFYYLSTSNKIINHETSFNRQPNQVAPETSIHPGTYERTNRPGSGYPGRHVHEKHRTNNLYTG